MNVLKNIREIRTQRHLSQEFMADKLGLTTSNYSRRESGKYSLSLDELAIIAKAFEMEMVDLLTWPEKYISTSDDNTMREKTESYGIAKLEVCENCKVLRKYIALLEDKIKAYEERE